MAYEKYTWQNGDVITAQKLNHIEGGVEANSQKLVVNVSILDPSADITQFVLDKTFSEIDAAFRTTGAIYTGTANGVLLSADIDCVRIDPSNEEHRYIVLLNFPSGFQNDNLRRVRFACDSENDYPCTHFQMTG